MSEAATKERTFKQRWAIPGSSHDRVVRIARIALPSAVGVLIAFLPLAPLDRSGDVSFILDKNEVDNAPERMRVEEARYTGQDSRGQKFLIVANQAIQRSSDEPIVDIRGMLARFGLASGPVTIAANQGRYDLDQHKVQVQGPVRVRGPEGDQLVTRNVLVNLKDNTVVSTGGAGGEIELGRFKAGRVQADLNDRTVRLDRGVRLEIVQGAVR